MKPPVGEPNVLGASEEGADGEAALFSIEIEVKFQGMTSLGRLPDVLGPVGSVAPGKIRGKGLQIKWVKGSSDSHWFGEITATWEQHSLRVLLDQFSRHSGQLIDEIDKIGGNVVNSCELLHYPDGYNSGKDRIPSLAWERSGNYWARVSRAWRGETKSSLPAFVVLFLLIMLKSNPSGGVFENSLYGALLGGASVAVNVLVRPMLKSSKGLVRRVDT